MTQAANLQRVSAKIGDVVWRFCVRRMRHHAPFNMVDLVAHVTAIMPFIAPDSPSRILRELRRQGRVDYVVVNRAASLYRVVAVRA
jgi:hypothetical protein